MISAFGVPTTTSAVRPGTRSKLLSFHVYRIKIVHFERSYVILEFYRKRKFQIYACTERRSVSLDIRHDLSCGYPSYRSHAPKMARLPISFPSFIASSTTLEGHFITAPAI